MFLTPTLRKWIRRSIRSAELVLALPFKWNLQTNQIELHTGWRFGAFYVNYFIATAHAAFVWYSCALTLKSSEMHESQKVIACYMAVYWTFNVMLTTGYALAYDDFIDYLNKGMQFLKDSSKTIEFQSHSPATNPPLLTKINEFLCFATWNGLFGVYVLLNFWSFFDPKMPTLVGPMVSSNAWVSGTVSTVVILYCRWTYTCVATVTMLNLIAILVGVLAVDTEFRSRVFKRRDGLKTSVRYYNEGRILLTLCNSMFCSVILPSTEVFFLTTCTFGFYGAIRLHGFTAGIAGFLASYTYFALVLMFRMPAEFYLRSQGYLGEWRQMAFTAEEQRVLRSSRPWKVLCGFYAFIDTELILTSTHMIVDNVVQLLMVR